MIMIGQTPKSPKSRPDLAGKIFGISPIDPDFKSRRDGDSGRDFGICPDPHCPGGFGFPVPWQSGVQWPHTRQWPGPRAKLKAHAFGILGSS